MVIIVVRRFLYQGMQHTIGHPPPPIPKATSTTTHVKGIYLVHRIGCVAVQ